jgi:hypothetical protein
MATVILSRKCARSKQSGLTTLEFAGCVTAVLGGMWIGALYLGVNVEHLAHGALTEAQLLDRVPAEWRPEGPTQNVVTREQLVATLRKELGSLRSEIYTLHHGTDPHRSDPQSDPLATARATTLAYWNRLNEIALGEDALQRDAETAIDDSNAAKVFAIKSRVSRFAAKGVEAVPSEDVDEAVVKFGRQLALWYDRAGHLYDRAVAIWETPGSQSSHSQLVEEWKVAERQHRHEARLLRERAAKLRASISRQFGDEFPEFAKQAASAGPNAPAQRGPAADGSATPG